MGSFRRFIIRLVEVLLILFMVVATIASALAGATYGRYMPGENMSTVMAISGGISGFLTSALLAAFYFLLAEIAQNTRRF